MGSFSRQKRLMSYASQRARFAPLTPTRSTITDEDFRDSSTCTSTLYLPIGPGFPGLHELHPDMSAAHPLDITAANSSVSGRFLIKSSFRKACRFCRHRLQKPEDGSMQMSKSMFRLVLHGFFRRAALAVFCPLGDGPAITAICVEPFNGLLIFIGA